MLLLHKGIKKKIFAYFYTKDNIKMRVRVKVEGEGKVSLFSAKCCNSSLVCIQATGIAEIKKT